MILFILLDLLCGLTDRLSSSESSRSWRSPCGCII